MVWKWVADLSSETKLRSIRSRINESGRNIRLEVDGGVKVNNIKEIAEAGADMFVAGSTTFDSEDYQQAIDSMRAELTQLN